MQSGKVWFAVTRVLPVVECCPLMSPSSARRRYDSLEQEAYLNLWRTYDCLKALEDDLFAPVGISPQQYNALRLLKAATPGTLTVQGLGGRLITRAPDMTRMLDRLERRGWIRRERRLDNRRVIDVAITDAGLELLEQLSDGVRDCHRRQLGHLTPDQLSQLVALLTAARSAHEPPDDAG
jgi:DNA-binding MarR family transcriptional regulator